MDLVSMCMGLVDLRVQDFVEEDIDLNKAMEDPLTPRIDEPANGGEVRNLADSSRHAYIFFLLDHVPSVICLDTQH